MRALLSAYDKTGLVDFARGLVGLGIEIVASGNTARALAEGQIAHVTVESVTSSPEMLSGRVKTLHPRIHAGILADLDDPAHRDDLARSGIEPISLVVCTLYPFATDPSIELIDIGGPTLVRAAAKNHAHVTVIVDPGDYEPVLDELRRDGATSVATRLRLASRAFSHVADYDAEIAAWFSEREGDDALPSTIRLSLEKADDLRYGENPHQRAALYRPAAGSATAWWHRARQHGGRALSYLNYLDADAAWRLVTEMAALPGVGAAAVVVKHGNACGAAVDGGDLTLAHRRAVEGDETSAFGGVVALSGCVDGRLAEEIVEAPLADVVVAEAFDADAVAIISARRKNTRTLSATPPGALELSLRQIDGGFLVQQPDRATTEPDSWSVVTARAPSRDELADASLAHLVCARSWSNAIVLVRDGQVVGVGCGQQSRVDAAVLAGRKAEGRAEGGAAASDAFFPFRDGLDAVADSGVAVVVQPGGSLRDDEVVAAADERKIAMVMTGERHFRH